MATVLRCLFFAVMTLFAVDASAATGGSPPPTPPTSPIQCAIDEMPQKDAGSWRCVKIAKCDEKTEIISYDPVLKKMVCKKNVTCGCPRSTDNCSEAQRGQRMLYIDGKQVCLTVPPCKAPHSLSFDGHQYLCN